MPIPVKGLLEPGFQRGFHKNLLAYVYFLNTVFRKLHKLSSK
ncbi:hypothetical protein B4064_2194 [Caldibacillus thermoamylovorans]|uniref:Uncharacterized protein n=1 Tax=Caldibacillus thermoamylovorans TaxID=35841 RepID=A0ABD4A5F6_9BACI|nr:hypothetical protein B4166_2769 [Caldibacillus thermoamylovorans]KIO66502.1 hypothetical protein B4064_2194 [Caldibacillus thermoamylovorans]KIO72029.1 hypothetical protein B4167_3211 [Caldibacillus thermoamylovorans]